jgi:hypothetical protein
MILRQGCCGGEDGRGALHAGGSVRGAIPHEVGSVLVERSLCRPAGERGGQPGGRVVDPVSLRAGVGEDGWLPGTARAMAPAVQPGSSREAEARARELGRQPYSRASFESGLWPWRITRTWRMP